MQTATEKIAGISARNQTEGKAVKVAEGAVLRETFRESHGGSG